MPLHSVAYSVIGATEDAGPGDAGPNSRDGEKP